MEIPGVAEVLAALSSRGARPRADWVASCLQAIPGGPTLPAEVRAEKCLPHLLSSDLNSVGEAVLPAGVQGMHKVELEGPFLLQIDEVCNISAPVRERYQERNAGPPRCLKLSLTDGTQRVVGIEYRPIPQLRVLVDAGTKIVVRNVHVRRGLLLLVPEILVVLGGSVEVLETARKRLVEEMNKPPRWNRNPRLTMLQRATMAAWPARAAEDTGMYEATEEFVGQANPSEHPSVPLSQQTEYVEVSQSRDGSVQHPSTSQQSGRNQSPANAAHQTAQMDEPFTYLALLHKKLSDSGESQAGRIKCLLTGVKGFHFKDRDSYQLSVYLDDGSLIAEAEMDDKLVEQLVGSSARQASAALAGSQEFTQMKRKLKDFQTFLTNFEGYMHVVLNENVLRIVALDSTLPLADCWALLDRAARLLQQDEPDRWA